MHRTLPLALATLVGVAILSLPLPAQATSFIVNRFDDPPPGACDPADCSLREAVRAANVAPDADTIMLPAGTYTLSQGGVSDQDALANDLDVLHSLTVVGAGQGRTVIDANSAVTNNRVFHVPGLEASDPTLALSNLTLTGGRSQGRGGAMAQDEGTLTMTNVTVSGNSDPAEGGGLSLFGTATLTNVTVSGNSTVDHAGGIFVAVGTTTLNNVTVSGNTADSDGTGEDGGGVWVGFGATLTLRNSLIAGNHDGSGGADHAPDCFNGATLTSAGNTLIGSTAGCAYSSGSGDVVNVDPMLQPLADNGGTTPTHALRPGSPAADAGNSPTCAPMDQRGAPRSGSCDIGAYEVVFCRGVVVNRVGTPPRDALVGTPGKDGFLGLDGNDLLKGRGGQDALCGGPGKDKLRGGGGKDRLDGGPGRDLCVGQAGADKARGCERKQSI